MAGSGNKKTVCRCRGIYHPRPSVLRAVANRIGELDRGKLAIWDGNYTDFLAFRERQLAEEENTMPNLISASEGRNLDSPGY